MGGWDAGASPLETPDSPPTCVTTPHLVTMSQTVYERNYSDLPGKKLTSRGSSFKVTQGHWNQHVITLVRLVPFVIEQPNSAR